MVEETQNTEGEALKAENSGEEVEKNMNYSIEYETLCRVKLTIEPDSEELEKDYKEQLGTYKENAQVPGFRPGKAPEFMVERRFGDAIKEQVLYLATADIYKDAVKEEDITVINELDTPDFENYDWEPGQPAKFEYRFEVIPSVDLDEGVYKGLEIEVPKDEVPEDLMEMAMNQFSSRYAEWEALGDDVEIDRKDSVEVVAKLVSPEIEGGLPENGFSFSPEQDAVGPFVAEGLNGAVVGAKVGDTVEIDAHVADEQEDEKWRELAEAEEVKLELTINEAYRLNIPEIDDDLAEKLGLDSADEIREMVETRVKQDLERQRNEHMRQAVLEKLNESIDVELPDSLIRDAAQDMREREALRLWRSEGVDLDEARQSVGEDESFDESAANTLKAEFVISKIADKERIYVTESELDEQIRAFAASRGLDEQKARRLLEKRDMFDTWRRDLKREKTVSMLLDNAQINEVEWNKMQEEKESSNEE